MCGMCIRADAAHKTGPGCGRCLEGAIKGCPNSTKGSQADSTAHSLDVLSFRVFSCADCSHARRAVAYVEEDHTHEGPKGGAGIYAGY